MKRRDYLVATVIAAIGGYAVSSERRSDRSPTEPPPDASAAVHGYGAAGYGTESYSK